MQEIYINLDDSGKLTTKEKISVYGGLIFLSKNEKDKFITQYKSIINQIKNKYYSQDKMVYSEIKNTNVMPKDKRRIINYIKKYYIVALIIKNDCVYKKIITNKASRGRFLDFAIRRMIKEIIKRLIKENKLDAQKDLKIIINIDNQTTKNNGYYNLRDGLIEELKYGIRNFNYGNTLTPIIFGNLEVKVCYQNSIKSYVVQAADILAGTIRKAVLEVSSKGNLNKLVNFKIIMP